MYGPLKHGRQQEANVIQIGSIPRDITLEITRKCPLNCLMCSSNGGSPHPFELSLNEWLKIIDELIDLGAKSFFLSGGEPFSCSYFEDVCKYISNRDVSFSIYTSGNSLTNNNKLSPLKNDELEFVSSLNIKRVVFNLEGSIDKTHDLMTCTDGSFNNTLSSIISSVDLGLITEVHFVPTLLNYKELSDIVSLAKSLGVSKFSVLRFVPQGRGKKYEQQLKLRNHDIFRLRRILSDLIISNSFIRLGHPFNPFLLVNNFKCNAGQDRITIRYDGLAVPCEAMKFMAENYYDNDVRQFSIKEIWNHSALFTLARTFESRLPNECINCRFLDNCGGGCPIQRLIEGDINQIDPCCTKITKKIFVRSFK